MEIPDFFIKKLKEQYNENEVEKIKEGLQKRRNVTFRINTLTQIPKIKYVITINIPEIVYALIFSFVCSFSSIFIFIMITHL